MLTVKDPETQYFIAAHHVNLQLDGVSGYWIGARAEDATGTEGFIWTDGYPLRYQEFRSVESRISILEVSYKFSSPAQKLILSEVKRVWLQQPQLPKKIGKLSDVISNMPSLVLCLLAV